ncbi:MAG: LPS translocon maturation chaperone LptM [Rhodoferax sp.]
MFHVRKIVVLALVCLAGLSGCGQTGALYLPPSQGSNAPSGY